MRTAEDVSNEKFDFLGYTFRPRRSKNRQGKYSSTSAGSFRQGGEAIRARFGAGICIYAATSESRICRDVHRSFEAGSVLRRFYRSALYPPMKQLDRSLARWAYRKYKAARTFAQGAHWVARISRRDPKLWATGRRVCGVAPWRSRMSCEFTYGSERARARLPAYSPGSFGDDKAELA